ncbi:hypothetical protein X728_15200 [Mesorhizobium sp. L103C120A0]|nr:hypothetical protein X728_15200 [Mesorhizobium sp. L103C120A0]
MSAAVASEYVRLMIHREGDGPGAAERAMTKLEARYGIGFWTLDHFRKRKAKTCDVALFARIKAAFIDHCGAQAARLIQEAEIAQAVTPNDDVAAIQDEIRALQARLAAAQGKAKRAA